MKFNLITIFPNIFDSYFNESILKRAQKRGLIKIKIHNLRDFTKDKHLKVDDKPYGGGPGMVMEIEPMIKAVEFIKKKAKEKKVKAVLFTPAGKQFNNKIAAQLARNCDNLILICGRYEGTDARLAPVLRNLKLKILELSVGPYVLTGGEVPAMAVIDAVARHVPGVLGKENSVEEKRFGVGVPAYTRPEIFEFGGRKYRVPKVLLSGDHKAIDEWRIKRGKKF